MNQRMIIHYQSNKEGVKKAMQYNEVTIEELSEGVDHRLVTHMRFQEIIGEKLLPR